MRRIAALPLVAVLGLTGCVSLDGPVVKNIDRPSNCLTIHPDAQASLQKHLDAKMTPQAILAIHALEADDGWYVAAHVDSQGDAVTAVWYTSNDPAAAGENAYVSVDAMAETISDYLRPTGAGIEIEGAQQAEACLN